MSIARAVRGWREEPAGQLQVLLKKGPDWIDKASDLLVEQGADIMLRENSSKQ